MRRIALAVAWLVAFSDPLGAQSSTRPGAFVPLPMPTKGSYGNDVVYYIVVDRFFDGEPANNVPLYAFPDDPSLSPGRRQENSQNRAMLPLLYDPSRSYMGMYWGGDLDGVRQKLDYLADLGVTKIVLTPIMDNANGYLVVPGANFFLHRSLTDRPEMPEYSRIMTSYHGYWCRDWYTLDEHFGSPGDFSADPYSSFRQLLDEAAQRGIGIMMDITLNQTSPFGETWIDQGSVFSLGQQVARFDRDACRHADSGWFHKYFFIDFTNPTLQQLEDGVLFGGMPDLDQDVASTFDYLIKVADFWLKINPGGASIAGFRVDAIKHVPLWFWQEFENRVISIKPDAILMGEYFGGGYDCPPSLAFASGTQYFSQYDFSSSTALRAFFAGDRSWNGRAYVLRQLLSPVSPSPPPLWKRVLNLGGVLEVPPSAREVAPFSSSAAWGLFIENHDLPRLRTQFPRMTDAAYLSAIAFVLTSPRVPILTYGTETALGVPWDPRERGLFGIGGDPFSRPMMIFPGQPGFLEALHASVKKLIAFRKSHDFLRFGRGEFFDPPGASASNDLFLWRYQNSPGDPQSVIYAYSTYGGDFSIQLPTTVTQASDILSNSAFPVTKGTLRLPLAPQEARVILLSSGVVQVE